jgi:hypothetical protein
LEADAKKEWEAENKKLSRAAKAVEAPRASVNAKTAIAPRPSPVKISVNIELSEGTPAKHSTTAPATPKSTASKRKRDQSEPSGAATPAKRSKPRVKKEPQSSMFRGLAAVAAAEPGQDDIIISGTYDIDIDWLLHPIFDVYIDGPFALNVFTDEMTGIWWAEFHWAMLKGIIKMDPGPSYETVEQFHTLGWRIRDEETGKITFGRNCTGKIRFGVHTESLEGYLYDVPGAGRIDFQGLRRPGPRRGGNLSREWERFVEEAYGTTRH